MKQTLLFIAALFLSAGTFGQATDLFFSEYIEGSSNNKYLEIYNGTGNPVDLSDYQVLLFSNGNADEQNPNNSVTLSGMLSNGAVFVIANSSANIYSGTVFVSAVTNYNGDDAVALKKISTGSYVDIIGRIGEDPGTAWTASGLTTLNATLVRKASVTAGITVNPTSGFPTLATEWSAFAIDDVSNLGSHSMSTSVGTVALTVPNGGEMYDAGEQVTITWTSSDINTVIIEVFNNDSQWDVIASNIPAADGALDFTIPANAWDWDGYKLRISDADNASVSDESDGTFTINGHDKEVFYHEFDGATFGGFVASNQVGEQVWEATHGSYARMNGFLVNPQDNVDWLVSPAINLESSKNEIFEFYAYYNFNGPDLQLFYTADFSGDASLSTWIELTFVKPSSSSTWQYVLVDISQLSGSVYFGFKYTSSTADGATDWRVNKIYVSGINDETTNIATATANLAIAPNPFDSQITVIANGIASIEMINTVGQTVLQLKGNNLDKMVIPTSNLTKGLYMIKITDVNGNVQTKKVIKK